MAEKHPFEPFMPEGARLLMLGTFPPSSKRWCMEFYYPNFTNDMWRIMGLCFFADKQHFVCQKEKTYRLDDIKAFLCQKGIALYDTCTCIKRTRNTASDKDLLVLEQTDVKAMLRSMPECTSIITAGQLATELCCGQFDAAAPKVGAWTAVDFEGRELRIYRMPSSSRAYPMAVEQKAAYYAKVFGLLGTNHHS